MLAIDFGDGKGIIPTKGSLEYINERNIDNLDFLNQFKSLGTDGISLNKTNTELEKISKELNMPKEKILAIAEVESHNQENNEKDDKKITLKNDKDRKKEKQEQSNAQKEKTPQKNNPNIKQEADLSQKVNDRYTLGDILGVPDGGKLVTVYSEAIENNTNSTKFTFLIKNKDGDFLPCSNLEQVGGALPTNNVYSSNYDGSSVTQDDVNSIYRVKSPLSNENYCLTINIGSMGTIDLGLGQLPRHQGINNSQTSLVTSPLKTSQTYNTRPEIKEKLLSYHSHDGMYAADNRSAEANIHEDCNHTLTVEDVDGNRETGNNHLKEKNRNLENNVSKDYNQFTTELDNTLTKLYNEKGTDDFFTFENFKSDFIKTYLKGNESPTEEEFESACNRFSSEHERVHNP